MKTFFKHLMIEYKMSVRDRTLFLMSYLFPLTFFFFMGAVMTSINPEFKAYLFPSMIMFAILTSTVIIVPNVIVSNREDGIYRSYKIYGIKKQSILFLIILSNFINILIVGTIIGLFSGFVFKVSMPNGISEWLSFILLTLLIWFVFITLAILLGNVVKNNKHTVMYTQLVFLPSILLGGIMVETKVLPNAMKLISLIFPSTHGMNLINYWSYHQTEIFNAYISILVLVIYGIALILFDFISFKYDKNQ